ncbi:diguanylate cyclase [Undibacterium sp. RuRC25W]|uniref:GGDEF domain-containing protein n=1 Tax=Undibacterium sp. RuRC25W TaxID=3413047 RepID=UPI003BF263C8
MVADQQCPLPINELQRIDAVRSYQILDTAPSLEFDALTRIAAHTFDMPIAVVAMMDTDRLWFKSRLGLDVDQLDRKVAFCAHTIMSPREPLIVHNLVEDGRFISNPLVVNAPHLRFYAGVPLVDENNLVLGTIAVIDSKPRPFTTIQRGTLADFGVLVMTALQSHRNAVELKQLALTDYLTGIANRAKFDIANAAEMSYAIRSGVHYSLICMDLNGFKQVNDQFGHPAGDRVLCEVARRLSGQMREGDLLVRLGGDEFAVVARGCGSELAKAIVHRLTDVIRPDIELLNGVRVKVGISIGVATSSPDCTDADLLFDLADKALYLKKQA